VTKTARKPSARKPSPAKSSDARRIQTRRSGVHGKGVFALVDLAPGETLIEYTGEIITWTEALERHPHDPNDPNHTFYFHIDEDRVIDAKYGGNSARWINHSCKPNCEADIEDGRVFIRSLRGRAFSRTWGSPGESMPGKPSVLVCSVIVFAFVASG